MGYVFDAMNQADETPAPKRDSQPATPQPLHSQLPDEAGHAELAPTPPNHPPHQPDTTDRQPNVHVIQPDQKYLAGVDDRLVTLRSPASHMSEEYRSIRTSLMARWSNRHNIIHTITSATPQEGKTITSVNLGLSLAELKDRRTLVLEADLRLPMVAKLLNIKQGPGLVQHLRGDASHEDIIHRIGHDGLDVIVAGDRASKDAIHLLTSPPMQKLLASLRQRYDHIIIDTPPIIELADAGVLGAISDEVLLIVRMNRTPRSLVEQAVRTLNSYNAPISGIIATDKSPLRGRYYHYRYGYRQGYRYNQSAA